MYFLCRKSAASNAFSFVPYYTFFYDFGDLNRMSSGECMNNPMCASMLSLDVTAIAFRRSAERNKLQRKQRAISAI